MTLILLAVSLAITLCVLAYHFAIYDLPFMVGLSAFRFVYAAEAGFLLSGLAAVGAALLSVALIIALLAIAKHPALRLATLVVFAIPAAIAGFALVHGVAQNAIDSGVVLALLSGAGGLFVGVAAMVNLNALGTSILSR